MLRKHLPLVLLASCAPAAAGTVTVNAGDDPARDKSMFNSAPASSINLSYSVARADDHATHEHHADSAEPLGTVHFANTCAPSQSAAFDRAVALLHSFGYERAENAFSAVASADPKCAMAYWGVAMSNFHPIWGPPSPAEFERGQAAARKARDVVSTDARERAWVDAISAFYIESAPRPHPERVQAFAAAMAKVAAAYPDEDEAQIFNALAILGVAYNSKPDKTYARQKEAHAILQRQLASHPQHPGVAHYMIHSFDYPELAPLALDAAHAYARIAPASPHALHMPSHIFTRLGLWHDSIASNKAAAATSERLVHEAHPGATGFDGLHAMDYLEYAYLQIADDDNAKAIVERVAQATSFDAPTPTAGYALAAVPARYALERRAWKEAAGLTPQPSTFPWDKAPQTEAIVHFARAVGAARSGDGATARAAIERLSAIETALRDQPGFDWATQVKVQRLAAAGWLAYAEKNNDEALARLNEAADLEDTTDKHPVTPGAVLPAREQLADLLRELKQPRLALAAYERSLQDAPARYNSLLGAAEAAHDAGDGKREHELRSQLAKLCAGSSSARARLARKGDGGN